jgi:hypothetical protein
MQQVSDHRWDLFELVNGEYRHAGASAVAGAGAGEISQERAVACAEDFIAKAGGESVWGFLGSAGSAEWW